MPNMSKADCIAALVKSGVSQSEANDIVDGMLQEKKLIRAQGKADANANTLVEAWGKRMDDAKAAAFQQKRMAAINVVKRNALDNFIANVRKEGFTSMDALEAAMVGSNKTFTGARDSAMARRWGILDSWFGPMLNDLENIPGALRLIRDDSTFSESVMREMINPESTGDTLARQVAQVFSDYSELSRTRANAAGAAIGKLEGWAPQNHDQTKMLASKNGSVDGWVQFVTSRLDLQRTFPEIAGDAKAVEEALRSVFTTITTGRGMGLSAEGTGVPLGPRNLAKGMGKSRVLHFKDGQAAVEYHQTYGSGNILHNVRMNMEYVARNVSLMETFGPNPEAMIRSLVDSERDRVRMDQTLSPEQKVEQENKLKGAWSPGIVSDGPLARWYAELSGQTFSPVNQKWARRASAVRGINSLSKLGGATLSAISDVFVKANALRYRGNNLFQSWHGAVTQFMTEGRTPIEQKQLSRQMGAFIDGTMGDLSARFNAQDQMSGRMASAMNIFFKWSGLTGWTEAHKAGYITALGKELGGISNLKFDAIDKNMQVVLRRHGIDANRWETMRKMVEKETGTGEGKYLVPELAHKLPDSEIKKWLPDSVLKSKDENVINSAIMRERNNLETQLMGLYADECRYAIIEPDDKTRAAMVWGTRPGTWMGEGLRFLAQFKSFPIAYYQRILAEGKWKRAADVGFGAKALGASHFIASALAFGYLAGMLKDLSKGKTPRDPRKWETWLAASMQSGGAGIFGDFLFGQVSRTGNTFVENLAGPTASTIGKAVSVGQQFVRGDVLDASSDAFRLVLDNVPGLNLWYARGAMDYLLLFHIREMLSPGTLRRTESKMRSEYNQQYLISPSSVIKRGGGFR